MLAVVPLVAASLERLPLTNAHFHSFTMPSEALPLEEVVPKPVPIDLGVSLRERQPEAPTSMHDPDQIQVELRSVESLAPTTQETGTTTRLRAMRRQANAMYASMLYTMLLSGWNDGTTGPLLPRIQAVYHVRYRKLQSI